LNFRSFPSFQEIYYIYVHLLLQAGAQDGAVSEPPRVRLGQNYIVVQPDTDTAQLVVDLASPSKSAVKVSLGVFSHDGTRLGHQLAASWLPGEAEPRNIEVSGLQQLLGGARRSLIVRITAANNAAIDTVDSSALVSLDAGLPQFAFQRNAAAFPCDQPKIDILLESGQITQAATLRYRFEPFLDRYNPVHSSFLRSAGTSGFLHIDANATAPAGSVVGTITVPIDWNQVSEDAQYKLGLQLEGFYASWTAEQNKDVAVHIFGVPPGTCPPGSSVKSNSSGAGGDISVSKKQDNVDSSSSTLVAGNNDNIGVKAALLNALPGGGGLSLLVRATPVPLSTLGSNIGAMVGVEADKAVVCVSNPDARVISAQVQSSNLNSSRAEQEGESNNDVTKVSAGACPPSAIDGASFDGTAWELRLVFGPNLFNISTSIMSNAAGATAVVQLSIVRLADPSHARVLSLEARGLDGGVVVVCGPPSLALGNENSNSDIEYSTLETKSWSAVGDGGAAGITTMDGSSPASEKGRNTRNSSSSSDVVEMLALDAWKPCTPGGAMTVTVPANTETVSLTPTLLHPEILDIRVEVNGQVLSRGGDVWADQQADTQGASGGRSMSGNLSSSSNGSSRNSNTTTPIIPAAFIMGMQPGVAVDVEVVVVAEDGVTSSHYPVTITRDYGDHAAAFGSGGVEYSFNKEQQQDWPASPAESANCDICPAGWTSTTVNASTCEMCPPGTAAATEGIGSCTPCSAGTFSLPWGSTHCKHCISGTHAPTEKATICLMCPDGFTTIEDGQAHCNVTLAPATDLQVRYAVVVYFSVNLTGSDPEDIVLKSGVSAPAESIVSNLLRTDTAAAFNISMQDVRVLSVHRVARRILQANVSATLGLDLPGNATEEDVAAALEVQKLSADRPIELLSEDPDSFFGRTTKTLNVGVEAAADVEKVESRPLSGPPFSRWILLAPGIVGAVAGSTMIFSSWWKKRSRQSGTWVNTLRITPQAQRYARQA
jgi:hypothetical protein